MCWFADLGNCCLPFTSHYLNHRYVPYNLKINFTEFAYFWILVMFRHLHKRQNVGERLDL